MKYFAIGIALAVLTFLLARLVGFDKDKAFYPTLVIVIATYYVLFAAMGAPIGVLVQESLVTVAFTAVAAAGFRLNLWLAVAALVAHGSFDLVHERIISNPGVPEWWPMFCLGYDVMLAACLAWILQRVRRFDAAQTRAGFGRV